MKPCYQNAQSHKFPTKKPFQLIFATNSKLKEHVAKRKDVIHVALRSQSRQRRRAEKEDVVGRDNKHSPEGSKEGVGGEAETRKNSKER